MAPEPEDEFKDEKNPRPLDEDDIAVLKTYVNFELLSLYCLFFIESFGLLFLIRISDLFQIRKFAFLIL